MFEPHWTKKNAHRAREIRKSLLHPTPVLTGETKFAQPSCFDSIPTTGSSVLMGFMIYNGFDVFLGFKRPCGLLKFIYFYLPPAGGGGARQYTGQVAV